mmetsp:Transcript_13879/g.20483  ORF Transcript_13879/g.20483 Transcript_13879/m.20483 type:complete len:731 (-) Transcript_13879:23-2215(-)
MKSFICALAIIFSSFLVEKAFSDSNNNDEYPRQYELWKSEKIAHTLLQWKNQYPDLVHVTTAQEQFGLDRAGGPNDCPHDAGDGCFNYIITIQDTIAHPLGSDSSKRLPEVFLSGCVHGNERVGPTAVMEAMTLLLEAAQCESQSDIQQATVCRRYLETHRGMNDGHRQWLARLVSTRRLVVLPTANALGYDQNVREEANIDPNRDFPFDVTDPTQCMQTIAGRSINEVFRQHLFQLALTFHGGTEVIAYEWGAPTFLKNTSPDDIAQVSISDAYSRYAAGFSTAKPYETGTMNEKVYYVRGGMEDWAYGGSWIPEVVIPCEPTTFSPYPKEKTTYNNATLRAFNMLVETSHQKIPPTSRLGTSQDVLNKDTNGNGHVSRNVRLALLAADLVEPYVRILRVNDLALSDDIVPLQATHSTPKVMIPKLGDKITIEWTIGGALDIDDTALWVTALQPEDTSIPPYVSQEELMNNGFTNVLPKGPRSGTGFFSRNGPSPVSNEISYNGPIFTSEIDVSQLTRAGDGLTIMASARVDQAWATQTNPKMPIGPPVAPQSHVVNARTNPAWHFESEHSQIQGRLDWFSLPLNIVVGDYDDVVGQNPSGRAITTIEVSNRFGQTTGHSSFSGGVKPVAKTNGSRRLIVWAGGTAMAVLVVVILLVRRLQHHERIYSPFDGDDDSEDDEFDSVGGEFGEVNSNPRRRRPFSEQGGEVELSVAYREDEKQKQNDPLSVT